MEATVSLGPSGPARVASGGHVLEVDSKNQDGPPPMAVLLGALGSCHATVLRHVLRVMKLEWEALDLRLRGELEGEDPEVFSRIHLAYRVKGPDLDAAKVRRAVGLAGKYCSVSALLERADVTLTHDVTVEADGPQGVEEASPDPGP